MPIDAGLGAADCDRLRDGLVSAGYDLAGVQAVVGDEAVAAIGGGERVPALRATDGGSPVETLVRLFLLGTTEQVAVVCNEGYTSSLAAYALRRLGVSRATDIVGGYRAWRAAGLPTVPGGSPALP